MTFPIPTQVLERLAQFLQVYGSEQVNVEQFLTDARTVEQTEVWMREILVILGSMGLWALRDYLKARIDTEENTRETVLLLRHLIGEQQPRSAPINQWQPANNLPLGGRQNLQRYLDDQKRRM